MKGKIEDMSIEELGRSLKETKEELRKERFKSVTSKLENPQKIKALRRHVARVNTIMREYELGIRNLKGK
ncbi:MAG TPA: 50S ribosomal protein L29 [Spirochaetota bacterium]|nr:50S ribosomal protein L29 [Spirochaetota bacterium]HNT11240.1 50S ribosomal protein L29 [Spirochaetota bacterium]HNV48522.1 50S ribosomal protein L29 [Spirochaetota bacterium]HOS41251.1 50S ribosomal protein L29 [Spirochaetota bacterium]HPU88929.1 50S ribosomal protein L29 [Spirochaetota bacterium]